MRPSEVVEVKRFWQWFEKSADALARSDFADKGLIAELDRRIFNINSDLSWEIGPGGASECQLVISPNLDPELLPVVEATLSLAPKIEGWDLLSFRPRKQWQGTTEIVSSDGTRRTFNTGGWSYAATKLEDGAFEIYLLPDVPVPYSLESGDRWVLGAVVLEAILGEEFLMRRVPHWEVLESSVARGGHQFHLLRDLAYDPALLA